MRRLSGQGVEGEQAESSKSSMCSDTSEYDTTDRTDNIKVILYVKIFHKLRCVTVIRIARYV